jgi:hypothetical protein
MWFYVGGFVRVFACFRSYRWQFQLAATVAIFPGVDWLFLAVCEILVLGDELRRFNYVLVSMSVAWSGCPVDCGG